MASAIETAQRPDPDTTRYRCVDSFGDRLFESGGTHCIFTLDFSEIFIGTGCGNNAVGGRSNSKMS